MTATIQRRIEVLESKGVSGIDFILILRRVITPNVPPGEATHARALGQHFTREPAETEPQFIERIRAHSLAHRRPGQRGVSVLMAERDLDL